MESFNHADPTRADQTAAGPAPVAADALAITVVIPTFNRSAALLLCLQHLERQTIANFDVIVMDDGSTDDTPAVLARYQAATPLRLLCLRQPNAGPARARNAAIARVAAPICLMIGDDIFASPVLVEEHLRFHQQHTAPQAAALGVTEWAQQGQTVTPFMRWLDTAQIQFSYIYLLAGRPPFWGDFFTSNLSLKTHVLRANPFNELFPGAAMEDIELGYRLHRSLGLDLQLLPCALASHLHPTTFLSACRRMQGVGLANRLFQALWPEHAKPEPGTARLLLARCLRFKLPLAAITTAANLLTRIHCPNPLMDFCLRIHTSVGFRSPRALELARRATNPATSGHTPVP